MPTVSTIGHSTRELDDFLALLTENKIESLADVRRFPGSRRFPHFNRDALSAALRGLSPFAQSAEQMGTAPLSSCITYTHFPTLGGRRTTRKDSSPNTAWRVAAFAAYADYMLTDDFKQAFKELQTLAANSRTAIMCAEALPWRCHRRLIADQFIAQGWQVLDIIGPNKTDQHTLPDFATVVDGHVTYPA